MTARAGRVAHAFATAAAAVLCAIGLLVLVGWGLDIGVLRSLHPSYVAMAANTAACFVLAGWSLWSQRQPGADATKLRMARVSATVVALVGAATLGEYLTGLNLGIDELLMRVADDAVRMTVRGRMAPATAVNFLLAGVALLTLDRETPRGLRPAQWLALPLALISLLATVGYLYGVSALYAIPGYTSMALHTAVAFLLLAAGIVAARPDRGWVRMLTGEGAAGVLARRLLPAAVLVPVALGWLRLMGQRAGLYATEFGVAIFAISTVMLFTALVWTTVRSLELSEAAREKEHSFSDAVLASLPGVMCLFNERGQFLRWNRNLESVTGYSAAEMSERGPLDFLEPAERAPMGERIKEALAVGWSEAEANLVARDGTRTPYQLTGQRILLDGVPCLIGVGIDISRRREAEEQVRLINAELEGRVRDRTMQLEAANQDLEAFAYSVSHDLRAPLRAIDGYSRILLEDYSAHLEEEGRRMLGVLRGETQRMDRLILDLLEFSRLGRQALVTEAIDMTALARAALTDVLAAEPGRVVQVTLRPLPPATGAPAMMRQVWVNLLSNAVKVTRAREHAAIEVGGDAGAGECTYYVKDNGVGFDMRFQDKLFRVFQRLHSEEEFEGTGIGLALVQRVIARHGGRVWAEGRVGGGATFYFTLPERQASRS